MHLNFNIITLLGKYHEILCNQTSTFCVKLIDVIFHR